MISAVVLVFSGQGMAASDDGSRRRNNRRNDELPGQEAPDDPLPLRLSRRRSRSRKLGQIFLAKVFTEDWQAELKQLRATWFDAHPPTPHE
jgi:hypothetical protein